MKIQVPKTVSGNREGYEFLSRTAAKTILMFDENLILDFEDCTFFEGNLCAILGAILLDVRERKNIIEFINLKGNLSGAFTRNGFIETVLDIEKTLIQSDSAILLKSFKSGDDVAAKNYFEAQIFEKRSMPTMSKLAKKRIIESIFEVCINALTHGECDFVYCCGQLFYRQTPPRAVITIVDLGKTIKANVNNYRSQNLNGNESIIWALQEGNTTKTGNTPGGLGLKVLQDLINMNKGKLQFISGDGFIEYKDFNILEKSVNPDFPGTIVTIELLLNDTNQYILTTEESNIKDIIF